MRSRWKQFRHRLEYAGVRLAFALVRLLPLRTATAIGAGIGWFAYVVIGVRRRVCIDNITAALGVSHAEANAIARRSYMNLGRSLMEYASFERLKPETIREIVRFENVEAFDRARDFGKGAVVYTGHFGNWELMGAAIVNLGYPIDFLVGEQTNHRVDEKMNELRSRQGIGIISRDMALKKVLRALKDNRFVAMLADQDARNGGVFVDFLGRPASTVRGPAMFAIRQGCPVVSGFAHREGGIHVCQMYDPLWPREDLKGDDAVIDLTQRFTDLLTEQVRRYPDEYFWAHKRWKTKPPQEAISQEITGVS